MNKEIYVLVEKSFDKWLANLVDEIYKSLQPKVDLGSKKLLSAKDVEAAYNQGISKIQVSKNTIVTALAADFIKEKQMILVVD